MEKGGKRATRGGEKVEGIGALALLLGQQEPKGPSGPPPSEVQPRPSSLLSSHLCTVTKLILP